MNELYNAAAGSTGQSRLEAFFCVQLRNTYSAEQRILRSLARMREAATSWHLKRTCIDLQEQTKHHIKRLESVFEWAHEPMAAGKCTGILGITEEGVASIDDTDEGSAQRDVAVVFFGQKIMHYQIAMYGGLIALAKTLGYDNVAQLLSETLAEEKDADALLSHIAEQQVNFQASLEI